MIQCKIPTTAHCGVLELYTVISSRSLSISFISGPRLALPTSIHSEFKLHKVQHKILLHS